MVQRNNLNKLHQRTLVIALNAICSSYISKCDCFEFSLAGAKWVPSLGWRGISECLWESWQQDIEDFLIVLHKIESKRRTHQPY